MRLDEADVAIIRAMADYRMGLERSEWDLGAAAMVQSLERAMDRRERRVYGNVVHRPVRRTEGQ